MEAIEIQKMKPEDAVLAAQIIDANDLFELYGLTEVRARELFLNALQDASNLIYALRINGVVSGFYWAIINGAFGRSLYLRLIAIHPEYQSKGLGEKMIRHMEKLPEASKGIFLLSSKNNFNAQRFYQRNGYQYVGEIKDYLKKGLDELLFFRNLSV
jgi:[ribosomal protein S18]-alanine N-acetyltransferase